MTDVTTADNKLRYALRDDYSEGCHERIFEAFANVNRLQAIPYGDDEYSENARKLIQQAMGKYDVPVYFISSGTLTNLTMHAVTLRGHEAVIAAHSGHIKAAEAGAIEAVGAEILFANSDDGKLSVETIQQLLDRHVDFPHVRRPRAVYISQATEYGTLYGREELTSISEFCRNKGLYLMIDGARLSGALASDAVDLTLKDYAQLSDIFWIGGTKNGAMFGEALVIPNETLADDIQIYIKQRGALLAKGRMLGLQFQCLFTDDLYLELARHANQMASKLAQGIEEAGYRLKAQPGANMLFAIFPKELIEKLHQDFDFYIWEPVDEAQSVVRLVTSWATDEQQIDRFIAALPPAK